MAVLGLDPRISPAIHVLAASTKRRRGWPAFAGQDDIGVTVAPLEALVLQRILSAAEKADPLSGAATRFYRLKL
jgi:hypothetical protein